MPSLCGMVALHDLHWNFLFSHQMICKQYIILNHVFSIYYIYQVKNYRINFYHPQSFGQGDIFKCVCLSMRGWLPSMHHRSHEHGVLHPGMVLPPVEGVCIQVGLPPGGWTDPPRYMGYGQQVGSMHPTGMHSCCLCFPHFLKGYIKN